MDRPNLSRGRPGLVGNAVHASAALLLGAEEFVTTEKPGKPIYRVDGFQVIYLLGG